jgi:hypothetical protein
MPTSVIFLGQVAARLPIFELYCNCRDRHRRLRTARLVVEHGAGIPMPDLLRTLSADCPRRLATELERRTT